MKWNLQTRGGITIEAETALEVIEKMKASARFLADQEVFEYMEGVAERELVYSGFALPTQDPDSFVEAALQSGLLQKI